MEDKVFSKYIETINFFEKNNKNSGKLFVDLLFPWDVKILNAMYQPSISSGKLIFVNKGVEMETSLIYPYLPFIVVFLNEESKKDTKFWYKLEANEKRQVILLNMDKEIAPHYLLSRKAEIIREAILEQLNLEKFADEFNKKYIK